MEEMHAVGAAHEHVADPRYDQGDDVVLDAVFDDDVAVMAVHTGKENDLRVIQNGEAGDAVLRKHGADDIVLFAQPVFFDKIFDILAHVADNDGALGAEGAKIPGVGKIAPQEREQQLGAQNDKERPDQGQEVLQKPADDVEDKVRDRRGQHLAVDHFRHAVVRDQERIVGLAEGDVDNKKEKHDQPVALGIEGHGDVLVIVDVPGHKEWQRHEQGVQKLDRA